MLIVLICDLIIDFWDIGIPYENLCQGIEQDLFIVLRSTWVFQDSIYIIDQWIEANK